MKIAIFGGSFNPVHLDHIKLAISCGEEFGLDKIIFIPTYKTPLKENSEIASADDRLNMCKLAVRDLKNLEVSDIEIKRKGLSYTSDTIKAFVKDYKNLHIIVGADMFMTLDQWHEYEYIFENATIIAYPRNDFDCEKLRIKYDEYKKYGCKALISKHRVGNISSTLIRQKIKDNQDVSDFLDGAVIEYINKRNLYR